MTTREKYGIGLCIRVPEEVKVLIKTSASVKNISMQKWILRAIMKQIDKEKTFE